ncbi:uncharacterized protein LOC128235112 [Mya arenaria]|uniref:uncharacterized protein LOC128235112 n=1 Tax=Mya arenaria TaxID=6604 RepID=UPI0022E6BF1C|nr:uncharacterized protein LOC128235112 [Mya arenaria]
MEILLVVLVIINVFYADATLCKTSYGMKDCAYGCCTNENTKIVSCCGPDTWVLVLALVPTVLFVVIMITIACCFYHKASKNARKIRDDLYNDETKIRPIDDHHNLYGRHEKYSSRKVSSNEKF